VGTPLAPDTGLEALLLPSKAQVIEALHLAAANALAMAERAQAIARDEATSPDSKAEGKYDTRATEASYLARGQAERVVELRALVGWLRRLDPTLRSETVSLGALVGIGGDRSEVLFVSRVGGAQVEVDGVEVKTISLAAPLGRAMLGLEEGDDFEVKSPAGNMALEVVRLT
jgi:transcription elongation GreA/GreB family factor